MLSTQVKDEWMGGKFANNRWHGNIISAKDGSLKDKTSMCCRGETQPPFPPPPSSPLGMCCFSLIYSKEWSVLLPPPQHDQLSYCEPTMAKIMTCLMSCDCVQLQIVTLIDH